MNIGKFIKSPLGNALIFAVFVGAGGFMYAREKESAKAQAKEMTRIDEQDTAPLHSSMTRAFQAMKRGTADALIKTADVIDKEETSKGDHFAITAERLNNVRAKPAKPRVPPLSLFAGAKPVAEEHELSKTYAPYGRMIPCETVITLESSKLDTPVVGLVTEDVWHDGRLVIPAGAEVHGRASLDRSRERISASGRWVVVWRDSTEMNGTELVLNGIALEREKNDTSGEFGLRDGSAGLVGDLVKSDNFQEIKLFASTFLAGVAGGLERTRTETTALGVTQVTTGSARDAAFKGTSDVLNTYARQIQEAISKDGFFVRIPAGKQFYIYVTETIDQTHGTRGNRRVEDIWKNHEN